METISRIGPPPKRRGETWISSPAIAAVTAIVAGGRSSLARSSSAPQPASTSTPATATAGRIRIVREPYPLHGRLRAVRPRAYDPRSMSVLLASADLLKQPLATAEFVAVDTETNGLARERCEMTEVGAVLVGGGELHDRWSSLVGVASPLTAGIQRFTGITQDMVDRAPPPEAVLPDLARLLRGRVLVAHNARFDHTVLRGAFARAALDWPEPPVLCTVALARRHGAAAAPPRALRAGRRARDRGRPSPIARCPTRRRARACSARCSAGSARTPPPSATRSRCSRPSAAASAGARRPRAGARRRPPAERPDFSALPKDPGVYVFRDADGRPLYVGKSVCLRTRARAHFTTPAAWTGHAEHVDYQATQSELGALLLEDRLIKALRPPGNKRGKRSPDGYVYLRCRLDIPFPILEVAPEPATGHAVTVGPVRGRAAAAELVEQLNSLFGLRHCGRRLPRREHPSAYGQMGRCLSPCLGDLDPNLYRERLDGALRLFVDRRDGGGALLAHLDAQRRDAVGAAQLRARRLAPAPARAARGPRAPARRAAARHPRGRAARGRPAPGEARPLRRLLDLRRPRRRLGRAARRRGRAGGAQRRRAARRAAARARRLAPARARSARRGSSARGWRATARRRSSSTPGCSTAGASPRWVGGVRSAA